MVLMNTPFPRIPLSKSELHGPLEMLLSVEQTESCGIGVCRAYSSSSANTCSCCMGKRLI